jgi:hypothetical protein
MAFEKKSSTYSKKKAVPFSFTQIVMFGLVRFSRTDDRLIDGQFIL